MPGTDAVEGASLRVGLQEWAVCCRALAEGRTTLIVRKGGIHERGGGLFRPEHERFLLMPTYLHQQPARLRPTFSGEFFAPVATDPAPGAISISAWASVARVWKASALERVRALGSELIWSDAELAARFTYRAQPWLYVLVLRVQRFAAPVAIRDEPAYAGCRSWVPLTTAVALDGSTPALDDRAFADRVARIAAALEIP